MKITTWLDRITDESNTWLSAVKAEEGSEFGRAATLYLEDASESLEAGSAVRAALSCSCAASCLWKLGAEGDARRLYFEAGVIYSETAGSKFSTSLREALWALQRAYICFVMAGDVKESEKAKDEFHVLAGRANPFVERNGFDLPEVSPPVRGAEGANSASPKVYSVPLGRLLMLRRKSKIDGGPIWDARKARESGEALDQESLAGQLG